MNDEARNPDEEIRHARGGDDAADPGVSDEPGGDEPKDAPSSDSGNRPDAGAGDEAGAPSAGSGRDDSDNSDDSDELARMREAMLRLRAEMDNREKRLEREMAKTRKFAVERLVGDLIPVLDSMDQALASAQGEDGGAGLEGMELTRKQALKVLGDHGLEVLDPLGEAFDPTWHEAITTQPSEEQPADTVLQVLQKGYRLSERLIRPARVIVAKAP